MSVVGGRWWTSWNWCIIVRTPYDVDAWENDGSSYCEGDWANLGSGPLPLTSYALSRECTNCISSENGDTERKGSLRLHDLHEQTEHCLTSGHRSEHPSFTIETITLPTRDLTAQSRTTQKTHGSRHEEHHSHEGQRYELRGAARPIATMIG